MEVQWLTHGGAAEDVMGRFYGIIAIVIVFQSCWRIVENFPYHALVSNHF